MSGTPGPWHQHGDGTCPCGMVFGADNDTHVATAQGPDVEHGHGPKSREEQIANARLIAAAPRLAEALARLSVEAVAHNELHSDELMEAVEDAHAALREAGVE